MNITNLDKIGDVLAIPFFLLSSIYFYNIVNKTYIEYVLLLFSISGFLLDILFTYIHYSKKEIKFV